MRTDQVHIEGLWRFELVQTRFFWRRLCSCLGDYKMTQIKNHTTTNDDKLHGGFPKTTTKADRHSDPHSELESRAIVEQM